MTTKPATGNDDALRAKVLDWLFTGEVGLSSERIARHMLGYQGEPYSYPYDQWDFGRCVKLLNAIPELRERLSEMAAVSSQWAGLVAQWDEIESSPGVVQTSLIQSIIRRKESTCQSNQ